MSTPTTSTRSAVVAARASVSSAKPTSWHPTASPCSTGLGCGPEIARSTSAAGPRGLIELLFERVSPGGQVVGADADPAHLAMATELVASLALEGVEIVSADARDTGLASDSFDLVHARALLVTLPEPAEVVAEMVRLVRPGGCVVSLEPDNAGGICYPPNQAFDRLSEIFPRAFARNGADPQIGRRLGELYREAGLEDVRVEARAPIYPPGHSRRTIRADLIRALRPQILQMGLADAGELDELDAALREHLDKPETLVLPSLFFLAWGRKPALPDHLRLERRGGT